MVLVVDNYDSFTYNLVQYLGELGADINVLRNDDDNLKSIRKSDVSHIVISPGPGSPKDAGYSNMIIKQLYQSVPILGVCLGHQCIGELFGADTIHAPYLMHGKTSPITHDQKGVFAGLDQGFLATRYHSLVVDETQLPEEIIKTAYTDDKILMGIRHKTYPLEGIQFHPESILTEVGKTLLKNFLNQ